MEDYLLTLYDRIEVIKTTNKKYDLEHNAYISFSGGKDSTVLHYLIDLALPQNRIPRVFIDTGIEYNYIHEYVLEMAKNDDRFVIIKPMNNIKQTLEKYGYPFKSKEHSLFVNVYQNSGMCKSVKYYLSKDKMINCPSNLRYQFTKDFNLNISNKCCYKLKKEPISKWQIQNKKSISLTGMRKNEGGERTSINCIITDKQGNLTKFHPLAPITDNFENWFIDKYKIKLCKLYYEPFNFKRTGCKGCPFALDLQNQLDTMEQYLPNEKKQCEIIWKPIYDEYRRIGYRLKHYKQLKLF